MIEENEIHVHVPAGAVPKDGPSAGTALATSILSALLGRPPREKTCMTGEITLHGKVLPIGGVKEKVLAAQREGLNHVLLPAKNKSLFETLPTNVKKGLKFKFVTDFDEVFEHMFGNESGLEVVPGVDQDGGQLAS